jgi:hypothetical protein
MAAVAGAKARKGFVSTTESYAIPAAPPASKSPVMHKTG